MTVEFLAIIPARLASTRLPRKPLADIAGKPMVVHVVERARASGASRVVVATDAQDVVDAMRAFDIDVLLTSPHHPTGTDRLAEVVTHLALPDDAIIVNVQGDEPLIDPAVVSACAQRLAADPTCAIATAAHPIETADEFLNPNVVKIAFDTRGRALYFSRAPIPCPRDAVLAARTGDTPLLLPAAFTAWRHIGLYAYRAGFLRQFPTLAVPAVEHFECLEQLRALAHGYAISVLTLTQAPPAGVDTPEDLARVRRVIGGMNERPESQ